jgi:hypothetical protein
MVNVGFARVALHCLRALNKKAPQNEHTALRSARQCLCKRDGHASTNAQGCEPILGLLLASTDALVLLDGMERIWPQVIPEAGGISNSKTLSPGGIIISGGYGNKSECKFIIVL